MKRDQALVKLSSEHHAGLRLAQLIKSKAPEYKNLPKDIDSKLTYTLDAFSNELQPHFKCEEDILIPFITGKNSEIYNLNKEILDEHNQIYSLIELLKLRTEIENNLNKLGFLLESHIRKEERLWFEKIQTVLSTNELEDLGRQIQEYKFIS